MKLSEKFKNFKLTKYILVEFCIIFISITIFLFYFQTFIKANPTFQIIGAEAISFSGYELVFGNPNKPIKIVGPAKYTYLNHPITFLCLLAFILLLLGIAIQILSIYFRNSKKVSPNAWKYANIASACLLLIAGIMHFFFNKFYELENISAKMDNYEDSYLSTGSILSAIFIISCSLLMFLNLIEKKDRSTY